MKTILKLLTFVFVALFFSCESNGQQDNDTKNLNNQNNMNFYPFEDYYIDLNKLERVEKDSILSDNFKTLSKYAVRFSNPIWFEEYPATIVYNKSKFELENTKLKITDLTNRKELVIVESAAELDNVSGNNFLIGTNHGVLWLKRSNENNAYIITKYDEKGKELYALTVEHTDIIIEGNIHHHKPYLTYFMHTDNYLVFTSYNDNYKKTYVVDTKIGVISFFELSINGVIRDEAENEIIGFIETDTKNRLLTANLLSYDWNFKMKNNYHGSAETVLIGDILVIASFDDIATGSALSAFDVNSGEQVWEAEVKQLNVGHSEYYNKVLLSCYKDKVIMKGIEAYGHYLQIFDIKTGERLFESDIFKE